MVFISNCCDVCIIWRYRFRGAPRCMVFLRLPRASSRQHCTNSTRSPPPGKRQTQRCTCTLLHTLANTHTHTHTDTRTHTSTGVSTRPHYEHISIPGRYQLPAGPSVTVTHTCTLGRTQASLYHQYRSASARSLNCHLYSQRPQPADIRTLCFVFFTFLSFEPGTSRSRVPRLGSAL